MPQDPKEKPYLSIQEVCTVLQISRPTFNKIREQKKLTELASGQRPRFLRTEVEALSKITKKKFTAPLASGQTKVELTVFSEDTISEIQNNDTAFDLRRIRMFDPFGVLNLFCAIVQLANIGKKVHLELEDNFICNHLRSLGFFAALEMENTGNIFYDISVLKTSYDDYLYPIGLTKITMRKQEAPVIEKINRLLRTQGFSESIGGYIGWVMGELVDNSMTHLVHNGFVSDCYLLAQRYHFANSRSECLIIGVADVGPGIHVTLRKNPKYADLTEAQAFLTAFKPKVSSWPDEYGRGKGLSDILGIAMGNQAVLRVESDNMDLQVDFRTHAMKFGASSTKANGTRFALVLVDHEFTTKSKVDVSQFIDRMLVKL